MDEEYFMVDSVEDSFINLVKMDYEKDTFHRAAEGWLGPEYRELGLEIIQELEPDLKEKFESYFRG